MAKKSGRLVPVILVTLALGGGAYFFFRGRAEAPPQVQTAALTRGTLTQTVTATGDLQPVEQVEVSSQISGLIREVLVDYNSKVKAGDVLARIDPATYTSRLNQAKAELANVRANHDLVKLNTERVRSLRERNLVSQQELDQALAQLAQAQAQLQIRAAAVENAEVDLARCEILAPIDGIVLDRQATVGKTVAASLNAPVLFILVNDLSRLQIEAAVSEADIGAVALEQTVNFTVDAFPGRNFRGTVRQIRNSPIIEQSVVTYSTIIDVANDALQLKPGMTANVAIVVNEREDVLLIPNSALRARIPEKLLLPPLATASGPDGAPAAAAPEDNLKTLLAELGHTDGRPTREIMQRVRELAAERGLALPERGSRRNNNSAAAVTTRTVFLPAGTSQKPMIQPVTARFGITDGTKTEVVSGLDVGATVVTGVILSGESGSSAGGGSSNPFGGGFRRF